MRTYLLLCASLFLASCITSGSHDTRTRILTLSGQLPQLCPLMVTCDENFDYHAYAGDIDSFNLALFFEPGMVKDKSSQGVLAAFEYMYFTLSFPSLKTDSSEFYVTSPLLYGNKKDSTAFKSEIIGYANGRLRGRVEFPVQQLTERIHSRSPDCSAGDMLGICYKSLKLKNRVDYVLDFDLELKE